MAQDSVAVPVDTAAVLLRVARDLQSQGRTDLAEALLRFIRQHYGATAVGADAEQDLGALQHTRVARSGRGEMTAWTTVYGVWLGVAIPAAIGASGPEVYGFGLLVGGPAGFAFGKSFGEGGSMSNGRAKAITFGWMWGTYQAIGWRAALHLGDHEVTYACVEYSYPGCQPYTYRQTPDGAPYIAGILGGAAGFATGALLTETREVSSGTMNAVQLAGLWGSWFGITTAGVLDLDGDAPLVLTLVAGDAAVLTAALVAPSIHFSSSRPWVISAAGLAGLVGGLGVDLIIQPNDDKAAIAIPMVASIIGLAVGANATSNDVDDGGGSQGGADAVLGVRDGRLSLGIPMPAPTILRVPDSSGRLRAQPGLKIGVFSVRF
jgi:hypothetical protein